MLLTLDIGVDGPYLQLISDLDEFLAASGWVGKIDFHCFRLPITLKHQHIIYSRSNMFHFYQLQRDGILSCFY